MVKLEQHLKQIKDDEGLMVRLKYHPPNHIIVLGDYSVEYWIQRPEALCDGETEICTVQELIECLALEKK